MFNQCSTSIPPENIRKPEIFLMFSGGIEMEHWLKWVNSEIWRQSLNPYRVNVSIYFIILRY